ncbi:hypothetical protein [Pontibacter mucosus]|uniref:hypothetical protein n=1 Tax=Pontibacter mucosus TaxID=1649266 RepID=UPI0011B25624|nr:hypothetical protein [Pontibacter mucosus]
MSSGRKQRLGKYKPASIIYADLEIRSSSGSGQGCPKQRYSQSIKHGFSSQSSQRLDIIVRHKSEDLRQKDYKNIAKVKLKLTPSINPTPPAPVSDDLKV